MNHTKTKRERKMQGGFYPVSVCLSHDDLEKLERIAQAFCCDSKSRAGRVALAHWHEHLAAESRRKRFRFTPRPEFAITRSPNSGDKLAKFYFTEEDMARLDGLKEFTGEKGVGRLVRAAVGWYVEHLNV